MVMEEKGYSIPIYEDGIKTEWSVDGNDKCKTKKSGNR